MSKASFKTFYLKKKEEINHDIRTFFDGKIKESINDMSGKKELLEILQEYALRGGKRFRGFLLCLSYRAAGGKEVGIRDYVTWVELLHAAMLILDDLIDKDDFRRGNTTIHNYYTKEVFGKFPGVTTLKKEKLKKYNENITILASDILTTLAYELQIQSNIKTTYKIDALKYLHQKSFETSIGEMLDIKYTGQIIEDKDKVLRIESLKTAIYTCEAPMMTGFLLAGKNLNKGQKRFIVDFAKTLGEIFQLQDDYIEIFENQKEIGKDLGSDLLIGKTSYIFTLLWEISEKEDKEKLQKVFGKNKDKNRSIELYRKLIEKYDIKRDFKSYLESKRKQANRLIMDSSMNQDFKNILVEIMEMIYERKK